MTTPAADTVHKFERAGLGKAPFRCVGMVENKFQACPGAPIQPGGSCDYCGAGIMYEFCILSADGRRFKVGCDCVLKTGDAGLAKVVRKQANEAKRAAKAERDAVRIDAALAALPSVADKLANQPHPYAYLAEQGKNALGFVQWMLVNAGTSGKLKACRIVEAAAKA